MQFITIMTLLIASTQYVTMMPLSNAVDHDHDIGGHALSAAHDDDDGDNDKDLYLNLSNTNKNARLTQITSSLNLGDESVLIDESEF